MPLTDQYVPKLDQREEVAAAIRAIFDAPDRSEAVSGRSKPAT
jgi:hypothetical protein